MRFRSLDLVLPELQFFLDHKVPQVKFVDRTFNCKRDHTLGIWRYLVEHDNGITNFHFEVSADIFDEEELELIGKMRPGLIQLEIGVQSTNPDTIKEIHRHMDLVKLKQAVDRVYDYRNTHQHLDLIAGLPYENYESFMRSFDDVYRMRPDQLQMGFLKVLKGSYMEEQVAAYDLKYRGIPPYEVLSTKWLPYSDVIRLKGVEDMVEVYYNSGQFPATMKLLEKKFARPSEIFTSLAEYYEKNGLTGISHSRLARYEILYRFLEEKEVKVEQSTSAAEDPAGMEQKTGVKAAETAVKLTLADFRDSLMYDLYVRENIKSRRPLPVTSPHTRKKCGNSSWRRKRVLSGLRTMRDLIRSRWRKWLIWNIWKMERLYCLIIKIGIRYQETPEQSASGMTRREAGWCQQNQHGYEENCADM